MAKSKLNELQKKAKQLTDDLAKVSKEIADEANSKFVDSLHSAHEASHGLAGLSGDVQKKVKAQLKTIVKNVHGKDYKIKKSSRSALSSASIQWDELKKKMKSKGITSAKKGLSRKDLESLFFDNSTSKFVFSQWNTGKKKLLTATGKGTKTRYYVK